MFTLPEHQISHLALPGVRDIGLLLTSLLTLYTGPFICLLVDFTTDVIYFVHGLFLLITALFDGRYFLFSYSTAVSKISTATEDTQRPTTNVVSKFSIDMYQ